MTIPYTVATLADFVGREIGISGWHVVDQASIDTFAACTGDCQWIHVDVELARAQAELGIIPRDASAALNYGVDKVRFLAPIRSNARVRNRVVLSRVEPKGAGRVLIAFDNTMEIEGADKPALVAQSLAMLIAEA